jgi:catechol 2,3-dioxygenase-like lactoylglutathione lyase family enzyme
MENSLNQSQRNGSTSSGSVPQGGFNALVPELDVSDIGNSISFWCDLLGFEIAYERPAAKFAYLEREGAQVMLCEINGSWQTGALEHPLGRGINLQIAVADVELPLAKLREKGWPLFREPAEAWYMTGEQERGSLELLVQDPDGYLVRLSQSLGSR